MQQLITPNLNISYTGGWCEKGVENAFGTNGIYTSAMVAWDNNIQHEETPPSGFYVPIYLDLPNGPLDKNSKTEGDVAISCPNGTVAACAFEGTNTGLYIYKSLQSYINDYSLNNKGAIYKGWGEYVGKIKVIEEEEVAKIENTNQARLLLEIGYMTPGTVTDAEANKLVGQDYETALDYIFKSKVFNDNKWVVLKGYPNCKNQKGTESDNKLAQIKKILSL